MKKYLLSIAVALVAAVGFTACSSDDDNGAGPTPSPTPDSGKSEVVDSRGSSLLNIPEESVEVESDKAEMLVAMDNSEDYDPAEMQASLVIIDINPGQNTLVYESPYADFVPMGETADDRSKYGCRLTAKGLNPGVRYRAQAKIRDKKGNTMKGASTEFTTPKFDCPIDYEAVCGYNAIGSSVKKKAGVKEDPTAMLYFVYDKSYDKVKSFISSEKSIIDSKQSVKLHYSSLVESIMYLAPMAIDDNANYEPNTMYFGCWVCVNDKGELAPGPIKQHVTRNFKEILGSNAATSVSSVDATISFEFNQYILDLLKKYWMCKDMHNVILNIDMANVTNYNVEIFCRKKSDASSKNSTTLVKNGYIVADYRNINSFTFKNLTENTTYEYGMDIVCNGKRGTVVCGTFTTMSADQDKFKGHPYVDLGLSFYVSTEFLYHQPTAIRRVNYFAWGQTDYMFDADFSAENYTKRTGLIWEKDKFVYAKGETTKINYGSSSTNNWIYLTETGDIAQVKWGGKWRMMTFDEMRDEFVKKCKFKENKNGNTKELVVTGPNGKTLTLPYTGYFNGNKLLYVDRNCEFWVNFQSCKDFSWAEFTKSLGSSAHFWWDSQHPNDTKYDNHRAYVGLPILPVASKN